MGGLTWFLAWWGLRRGYLSGVDSLGEFDQQRKRERKQAQQARRAAKKARREGGAGSLPEDQHGTVEPLDESSPRRSDPLHNKWMSFGGGFYGVVALLTWMVAEWSDVVALLGRLDDLVLRLQVDVLVQLFVNSLM